MPREPIFNYLLVVWLFDENGAKSICEIFESDNYHKIKQVLNDAFEIHDKRGEKIEIQLFNRQKAETAR